MCMCVWREGGGPVLVDCYDLTVDFFFVESSTVHNLQVSVCPYVIVLIQKMHTVYLG